MAKLPEGLEHLEHRDGVIPYSVLSIADCRRAIARTLPTRVHAAKFFDAVLALLGERALVDRSCAPDEVVLYVRWSADPRLVIGAPLVRLTRGGSEAVPALIEDAAPPGEARDDVRPSDPPRSPTAALRPQLLPRGPEMRGGAITLGEGHGWLAVEYDEQGVRVNGRETGGDLFTWTHHAETAPYHLDTLARPPSARPLSMLTRPGLDPAGHTVDELAARFVTGDLDERVAGDLDERVAWRVHVPVPVPMSIEEIVRMARTGLRRATFTGEIPGEARWAVADGFEGRTIAWGSTAEEALDRFLQAAFAKKPKPPGTTLTEDAEVAEPPPPVRPPSKTTSEGGNVTTFSTGTLNLSFPARPLRFPWPRAIPANVPAVLVELPALPPVPEQLRSAGYTRVVRCIGEHGAIGHLFVHDDEDGYTAIGEHVVDVIDPLELDAQLARADAEVDETLRAAYREGDDCTARRVVFTVFDDQRQCPRPARADSSQFAARLGPPQLDGDRVPWRVVRERGNG